MHDDREPEEQDEYDVADEVSLQDTGRPWAGRAIQHPSYTATRRRFEANPLPSQADRRAS